jgi:uncharacterized protein (DUF2235 family)
MKKRIAVCMDGTWSRLNQKAPTNIAKLARSVDHESADGAKQIVVYTPGVGAADDLKASASGALAGGLFGEGLEQDIVQTYVRLSLNYQAGDEIYIFGYSRGAFSARSLGAMIRRCGVLRRRHVDQGKAAFDLYRTGKPADHPDCVAFRNKFGKSASGGPDGSGPKPDIEIAFVGLFDTVGQRGLPSGLGFFTDWMNRKYEFHDVTLGQHVKAARHACAIDEARFAFPPTLWTNLDELNASHVAKGVAPLDLPYQQRWFPGTHGDIGGGAPGAKLANFSLQWIAEGAERAGMRFDRSDGSPLAASLTSEELDPLAKLVAPNGPSGIRPRNIVSLPKGQKTVPVDVAAIVLHEVAAVRAMRSQPPYRPRSLKRFRTALREIAEKLDENGPPWRRG